MEAKRTPPAAAPAKGHRTLEERRITHIETFIRCTKKLINFLHQIYPDDDTVWRTQQRVMTASDLAPVDVVEMAGRYLYKFHEQIYAGDLKFFIENDYDKEIRKATSRSRGDLVAHIIPLAKRAFAQHDESGQSKFMEIATVMLDSYIEFRGLTAEIMDRARR